MRTGDPFLSGHIDVTDSPAQRPPDAPTRAAIRRDNLKAILQRGYYFRPAGLPESERRWYELHRLKGNDA